MAKPTDQLDSDERLAANIHGIVRQFYPLAAGLLSLTAIDRYLPDFRKRLEARGWLIVPATVPPIEAPGWPECELCGKPAVTAKLAKGEREPGEPVTFYYCSDHD